MSEGKKLSYKQQVFVAEYLKCFNASEAARRAGYKSKSNVIGSELLALGNIREAIDTGIEDIKSNSSKEFEVTINGFIKRKHTKSAYVYLISAQNGLTKIGITNNVKTRLETLNTASPIELKLLFYFEPNSASNAESELHKRFAEKRVKGEWFNLSEKEINWIKTNYDTL